MLFSKFSFFSFFFLEEREEFMLYPTIPSPTEFCEGPDGLLILRPFARAECVVFSFPRVY